MGDTQLLPCCAREQVMWSVASTTLGWKIGIKSLPKTSQLFDSSFGHFLGLQKWRKPGGPTRYTEGVELFRTRRWNFSALTFRTGVIETQKWVKKWSTFWTLFWSTFGLQKLALSGTFDWVSFILVMSLHIACESLWNGIELRNAMLHSQCESVSLSGWTW